MPPYLLLHFRRGVKEHADVIRRCAYEHIPVVLDRIGNKTGEILAFFIYGIQYFQRSDNVPGNNSVYHVGYDILINHSHQSQHFIVTDRVLIFKVLIRGAGHDALIEYPYGVS